MNYDDFLKAKAALEEDKLGQDKKYSIISFLRLIVFFAIVAFLYLAVFEKMPVMYVAGALALIAFIVLISIHNVIDNKLKDIDSKSQVISDYIRRLDGRWIDFEDDGHEFTTPDDKLSFDLDLVGKRSLFQMLSIAHTDSGKEKLARTLSLCSAKRENIAKRNEAITELSEKTDFLFELETAGRRSAGKIAKVKRKLEEKLTDNSMFVTSGAQDDASVENSDGNSENASDGNVSENYDDKNNRDDKKQAVKQKRSYWMIVPIILIPALNIAAIVIALSPAFKIGFSALLISFIIGNVAVVLLSGSITPVIERIIIYGQAAEDYNKILKTIAGETFKSSLLTSLQERIKGNGGILKGIKDLSVITNIYNVSFNPVVHFLLSGLFGWDFYIALAAENWEIKNKDLFEESLDIIGNMEELSSLAVLSVIRKTVKPVILEDNEVKLKFNEAVHPLLNPDRAVANSSEFGNDVTVITGSNMSGKTTFLRTAAINMALAFMGANVCADEFETSYMRIFTSMRVNDDVAGGISTFYAEILRIKEMAEYIKDSSENIPAACFIDEIFKGTNSADRIVGATEALQKLSKGKGIVLVSTHDFELCDIKDAEGKNVLNYHFEEYYEGDEIRFDYHIRDGRCTTRNAMALLKMAGLSDIS